MLHNVRICILCLKYIFKYRWIKHIKRVNHTLYISNLLSTLARYDSANDGVLVASYDNDTVIMMAVITGSGAREQCNLFPT